MKDISTNVWQTFWCLDCYCFNLSLRYFYKHLTRPPSQTRSPQSPTFLASQSLLRFFCFIFLLRYASVDYRTILIPQHRDEKEEVIYKYDFQNIWMGFEISNFQYQYLTWITQYILFFVIHITEFALSNMKLHRL